MKNLFYFLLITVSASFLFTSCSGDSSENGFVNTIEIPLAAASFLNVSYGNNNQQSYDIYLPEGRSIEKTKVIILVHGGGWTGGDKADMTNFVELIKTYHPEHAIVNMNYVLATTTQPFIPAFPNQFLDIGRVIEQLSNDSEELQILPEFGLIGVSAGAHISLQYDSVYDETDVVKFVCDIVGPTNFTDSFYADNPLFNLLLAALVDESAYPSGTNYAEATSPVFQVTSNTSPTLLFYGNQDPLVPLSNGELLEDKLSNASVSHGFTIYEGGHGNWDDSSIFDLQQQLSDYINNYLAIEE